MPTGERRASARPVSIPGGPITVGSDYRGADAATLAKHRGAYAATLAGVVAEAADGAKGDKPATVFTCPDRPAQPAWSRQSDTHVAKSRHRGLPGAETHRMFTQLHSERLSRFRPACAGGAYSMSTPHIQAP